MMHQNPRRARRTIPPVEEDVVGGVAGGVLTVVVGEAEEGEGAAVFDAICKVHFDILFGSTRCLVMEIGHIDSSLVPRKYCAIEFCSLVRSSSDLVYHQFLVLPLIFRS